MFCVRAYADVRGGGGGLQEEITFIEILTETETQSQTLLSFHPILLYIPLAPCEIGLSYLVRLNGVSRRRQPIKRQFVSHLESRISRSHPPISTKQIKIEEQLTFLYRKSI